MIHSEKLGLKYMAKCQEETLLNLVLNFLQWAGQFSGACPCAIINSKKHQLTCVILSLLPSHESLSSYRGSLWVPMKIGSQCTKYPSRFPMWNTCSPELSGANIHSLDFGTLWQPGQTFLWKGMAVPFFSIVTCNNNNEIQTWVNRCTYADLFKKRIVSCVKDN